MCDFDQVAQLFKKQRNGVVARGEYSRGSLLLF